MFGLVILFDSSPIFLYDFDYQIQIIQSTGIYLDLLRGRLWGFRSIVCFKAAFARIEEV